ncbi:MAG: GIY-YIG nuclease family protein [Planctomycetes bacterium]|nr:GIY-YIG nuclease family protein [Planctomycetota bacterium]
MDKQHIINEIKHTAEKNNGVPLGVERFYTETGIQKTDWFGKYWARWGDALVEAGYAPNKLQGSYEDEWVIEKFITLIQELGRYPVMGELRLKAKQDKNFPSHSVFSRVGKKAELARKIIEYCKRKGGLNNIVEICQPITRTSQPEYTISEEQQVIGYVYLMKSGRYYKIGRTNALGRREYDLGIQLPDKITTVHTIKTDDPIGIEAYWHKRFEERRKNGEWFELTTEDVKAFKRRKFM